MLRDVHGTPSQHQLSVPRTARYATLGPTDGPVNEVWFVFHGYGQLAREFLAPFRALDDGSRLIVAPEGLSRFYVDNPEAHGLPQHGVGASWMTRDEREAEINDYVRYIDSLYGSVFERIDRARVTVHLLGFSQGAATATRWAVLGSGQIERLILWAGLLPAGLDIASARDRLKDVSLVVVFGEGDPYVTADTVTGQEAEWQRLGLEPEVVTFDGAHRLSKAVLSALAEPR